MQSSYYQNTGAMVTQFNRLDTITNNLANINTGGYKREDVVIGDFMRIFEEVKDELPLQNNTKEGAEFYNRAVTRVPHIVEGYTSDELGPMKQTGNTLDFALEKNDLYFAVETPDGVRLTRNGSFTLNNEGVLVNKSGHPVLSSTYFDNQQPIRVQQDQIISVDANGVIYTKPSDDAGADFEQLAAIMVTGHENQKKLEKEGDNLYKFENAQNLRVSQNSAAVNQGMLEMSNVNAVREMTSLIETQRMVEMYQKVMRTHMDDLNQEAITKLSTLKA